MRPTVGPRTPPSLNASLSAGYNTVSGMGGSNKRNGYTYDHANVF